MNLHIGPLPACPLACAQIARANALGYPTMCADTHEAMVIGAQYAHAHEKTLCDLA